MTLYSHKLHFNSAFLHLRLENYASSYTFPRKVILYTYLFFKGGNENLKCIVRSKHVSISWLESVSLENQDGCLARFGGFSVIS